MLKLTKIAVTGAVGAGKSTVCLIFKGLGAFVIDADLIVRQLLNCTTLVGKQVVELLGKEIVDGAQLDRKKIANLVFEDYKKLEALEAIVLPHVFKEIEELYQGVILQSHYKFFVVELPLLFEHKKEQDYDIVITVVADREICEKRLENRGINSMEYLRRMQRQLPLEEKRKKSSFVIENNGTMAELHEKVQAIVQKISSNI